MVMSAEMNALHFSFPCVESRVATLPRAGAFPKGDATQRPSQLSITECEVC